MAEARFVHTPCPFYDNRRITLFVGKKDREVSVFIISYLYPIEYGSSSAIPIVVRERLKRTARASDKWRGIAPAAFGSYHRTEPREGKAE